MQDLILSKPLRIPEIGLFGRLSRQLAASKGAAGASPLANEALVFPTCQAFFLSLTAYDRIESPAWDRQTRNPLS